jgi:hypothetical protein
LEPPAAGNIAPEEFNIRIAALSKAISVTITHPGGGEALLKLMRVPLGNPITPDAEA